MKKVSIVIPKPVYSQGDVRIYQVIPLVLRWLPGFGIEVATHSHSLIRCWWYYPLPIRKTLVPQTGHMPWIAGLPFLRVVFWGFLMSRLALHLTQ
jgi:hypothetical protein